MPSSCSTKSSSLIAHSLNKEIGFAKHCRCKVMEVRLAPSFNVAERTDGRSASQLRPLECSRDLLRRARGSATWSQENSTVLAAVYGPKPAPMKKENAPLLRLLGGQRVVYLVLQREYGNFTTFSYRSYFKVFRERGGGNMKVRRSLESIILTALHPNTAISVILQVISDDGSFVRLCLTLGIPLSGLLTAVSCGVTHDGQVFWILQSWRNNKAFVCLVFPSRPLSAVSGLPLDVDGESVEHGIVTPVTCGAMEVEEYFTCVENGRAAVAKISEFARISMERSQKGGSRAVQEAK